MESKKAIQISFIILLIQSVLALIYGLGAFILPEFLASRSYPQYTGESWDSLLTDSPALGNYIMILEGAAGGLGLTATIGNLFILFSGFRKGEKWAWFYILIVNIIGWGNILIANILMKNSLVLLIIASGLLLIVAALIVSAKAFLIEKGNA